MLRFRRATRPPRRDRHYAPERFQSNESASPIRPSFYSDPGLVLFSGVCCDLIRDSEYVDCPNTHFRFVIAARNWAIPDIATVVLVYRLADNLPVLADKITEVIV